MLARSEVVTPAGAHFSFRVIPTSTEVSEVRNLGDDGIRALGHSLLSPNDRECELAVVVLNQVSHNLALETVLSATEDRKVQPNCRVFAILGVDGPRSTLIPVLERLANDPDLKVQRAAVRALRDVQK